MAKFNYQLITSVQVEVTLEGLKKEPSGYCPTINRKGL